MLVGDNLRLYTIICDIETASLSLGGRLLCRACRDGENEKQSSQGTREDELDSIHGFLSGQLYSGHDPQSHARMTNLREESVRKLPVFDGLLAEKRRLFRSA